jgi:hypothetical protein
MSDPIAQAAQQIQHEDKPQGIAGEIMGAMHALEEKVEHFLHPDAPVVAQSGEPSGSTSQPVADTTAKSSEQQGIGEGNATALTPSGSGSASSANDALAGSSAAAGAADAPNAAGGASSDEQATEGSAPGATDGGEGEQGNVQAASLQSASSNSTSASTESPLTSSDVNAANFGSQTTGEGSALEANGSAAPNSPSDTAAEHPHTPLLRRIIGLLRRDFAMLPGELESWVKTAERHL